MKLVTISKYFLYQVLVSKLFEKWGFEGFEAHIKQVQSFYQSQRDAMLRCLNKHLKGKLSNCLIEVSIEDFETYSNTIRFSVHMQRLRQSISAGLPIKIVEVD